MLRVEALAISIAREHQTFEVFSDACRTLNPGMLRAHSITKVNVVNEEGLRVFSSYHAGHQALVANLRMKCEGKTEEHSAPAAYGANGKITPNSSLAELCKTFRSVNIRNVVEFLQDVLDDKAVNERTPISFFVEAK
jgi:hypothetical protein